MTRMLERRMSEFVDREAELRRFCGGLDGRGKPVMMIYGDDGLGKSSLLARMTREVAKRRMPRAEVVWTDTRRLDYLAVMRKICQDLGSWHFQNFTNTLNSVADPHCRLRLDVGRISVAEHARIDNSRLENIAGVVIRDSTFVLTGTGTGGGGEERMAELTDVFFADLASFLRAGPAVVFFDSIEKRSDDGWVEGELVRAVVEGTLSNLRVVLVGRHKLEFCREAYDFIDEAKLLPLERVHIIEYLQRRGIAPDEHATIADVLLVVTQGHPLQLATYVDSYLRLIMNRGVANTATAVESVPIDD